MVFSIDQVVGLSLLGFSAVVFIYYTVWIIVLPFVDPDHFLQTFFLPRFYAIAVPLVLVVAFTFGLVIFVAVVMTRKNSSKKKKD